MLYVDKYRPHTFDKFILHRDVADHLKKLVATGDCPHTLFYGPPGAGKRTLVMALLREIYGAPAEKVRLLTAWSVSRPSMAGRSAKLLAGWMLVACSLATLHPN